MQCLPEGNWKCILDFYLSFLLFLAVSLIWGSNFLLMPQMESFSFELLNLFSYLMNFLYLLILTDGEAKFCSELGAEMSLIRDCVTIWLNLSVPDELKRKKIRFAVFTFPGYNFHRIWEKQQKRATWQQIFSDLLWLLLLLLLSRFSHVRLCATPETEGHQAPPFLGFEGGEKETLLLNQVSVCIAFTFL